MILPPYDALGGGHQLSSSAFAVRRVSCVAQRLPWPPSCHSGAGGGDCLLRGGGGANSRLWGSLSRLRPSLSNPRHFVDRAQMKWGLTQSTGAIRGRDVLPQDNPPTWARRSRGAGLGSDTWALGKYQRRGGGGVWDPKVCVYQKGPNPIFPMANFSVPTVTLVRGGGGGWHKALVVGLLSGPPPPPKRAQLTGPPKSYRD